MKPSYVHPAILFKNDVIDKRFKFYANVCFFDIESWNAQVKVVTSQKRLIKRFKLNEERIVLTIKERTIGKPQNWEIF